MRFKLAILTVLASRRSGRATLDEVMREVRIIVGSGDQTEELRRLSALGDVDIFRSGWVLRDDGGLQITDRGRLLLDSLQDPDAQPLEPSSPVSQSPDLSDDIMVTDHSLRDFDHDLRMPDYQSDNGDDDHQHQHDNDQKDRTVVTASPPKSAVDEPERVDRDVHASNPVRESILDVTASYFAHQTSEAPPKGGLARHPGRAAFAFLTLALAVACIVAAIAFGQIQSLKSDILAQRRELLPLKERIARLEQTEKTAKQEPDEQEGAQNKSESGKIKLGEEIRNNQEALNLSREEVQLIRDYIKPAPSPGTSASTVSVGDPVDGAMIPLPSQLTEKVPKLLGGKFTTRSGAIVILKKGSRQADMVLAPN